MKDMIRGYSSIYDSLTIPSQEEIESFMTGNDNDISGFNGKTNLANSPTNVIKVDDLHKSSPSPPYHTDIFELLYK